MEAYGCVACHALEEGAGGAVGPPVAEVQAAGHPPEYLRSSILSPNADTTPGYEDLAGTMPPNFGERLTAGQLETLVRFLGGGEE
jgi:mono/diheme cytochrome c family protein